MPKRIVWKFSGSFILKQVD